MDSLANYGNGSDDDYSDSGDDRKTEWSRTDLNRKGSQRPGYVEKQADANYEEVLMDLSEESNDGSKNGRETRDKDSSGDDRKVRNNETRSKDSDRNRRRDRSRSRDRRDSREDDRIREKRDDRYGSRSDRYSREDRDYKKESYRDRKFRRSSSRDRRRSNSRGRRRSGSRERRRSTSRDRRYSRSPRRDRSRRSRSRSRSRGRYAGGPRRYGYPKNNAPRNDTADAQAESSGNDGKDRFFMPGITGKYREQIEKRKLLWQKKDPQKLGEAALVQAAVPQPPPSASTSRVTKIWEATTFAQDQDGKVASKFKRLMGIKNQSESAPAGPTDIIKKQEEMFSSMEQQYEVARTATHTMRGVGLGFSTSYPR